MSLQLEAKTAMIAAGRNWVAAEALDAGVAADRVPVIKLLSSELITNAVRHGPPGGVVTLRVFRMDGHLRVEVDDEGLAEPCLRHPTMDEIGGRGMLLVDTYASRWGWEMRGDAGKTVWFDLSVDDA